MATMTQSARIPGPSWDETIVPALRKRLESESRTLAKRMSAVSISSLDEGPGAAPVTTLDSRDTRSAFTSGKGYDARPMTNHTIAESQPRYQFDRGVQNSAYAASSNSSAQSGHPQRSRTYSQPYAPDQPKNRRVNGNGPASRINGTKSPTPPDSSRTVSPAFSTKNTDLKPTRIPQPRARTSSASSHQLPPQHRGVNGYSHASTPSSDLYPVHETRPPPTARSDTSSIAVPSRQGSGLLNEAPPFTTSSITSNNYHPVYGMSRDSVDRDPSPSRMSSESEERPFEHWYRGEVSRNGGVGELRVAKRMEMLEIANYGHTIKQKVDPIASLRGAPNRIVGNGMDAVNGDGRRDRPRRRKRADSVSGILGDGRESLYLDDERAREVARVMDEHPPTDLDDDGVYNDDDRGSDTETDDIIAQYDRDDDYGNASTMTAPTPTNHRSTTPTNFSRPISRTQNHPSRIPTPSGTRKSSESSAPHAPPLQRGASEPLSITTTALPTASSSQNRPTPTSSTSQHSKTRAKSPTSAKKPPSASARTRAKALAAKQQREEEESRRSVAYYPTPSGDEGLLKDAIPTWTQPKPKTGNWDEVVLPVVARKKGLDDHYEQADGSPRAKQQADPVAPAPGTFGYDHSKYRPPRGEDISMDEFGRPPAEDDEKEDKPSDADKVKTSEPVRVRPLRRNLETPPPFSHYLPANDISGSAGNVKLSQPIPLEPSHAQLEKEEEGGAGCCKCVIM
ncbi:hypothetical protein AB1N83_009080 [Pleurotus pulmonarius]